ncbi:MAG: PhoU domain-containing protein [Methanobrevibacter sp.]|jgi:phosphate transport system protein|nr:PhoU domain-containing protein [Methanobrevibacter sp.]MEE0925105.1 PhoU domain-containing protein [Methanobrevibacter sp.]
MTKRNKTLEEILDVIFYNNPSTQDEIAEELGISRRYVTKLLKPLIDQDIVKRAYILDMDKLEETYGSMNGSFNSKEHSANFLIQNMIKNMAKHVGKQVELSFEAVLENDKQIAEDALEMDFTTNNMFEKVRSSVETVVNINPRSKLSKILLFNEAAYNYERIGDYCGHIAKFVINDDRPIDEDIMQILKKMHKYSQRSISYASDAFIDGKIELKGDLKDTEEKMHEQQKIAMNEIANQMADYSFDEIEVSNYYLYLSRVVKAFERIGDISVEIMDLAAEFHKDIPRPTTPRTFRE